MIRKGIILAGGIGSRLSPVTKSVNKQLLPVYNKPLIFYSLSILLQNNIKNILIIVSKGQTNHFKKILPINNNLGIKIKYLEQKKPKGLPEAFIIGRNFIKNDKVALILGDNIFLSKNYSNIIFNNSKFSSGAKIFLCSVKNPKMFGVAKINTKKKVVEIEEKPSTPKSNLAITGLYLFDKNVIKYSKSLKPSKRNELEIVDLLKIYKLKKYLNADILNKNIKWFDAGSVDDLLLASNFIKNIEKKKKIITGCLEQIAYKKKWINSNKIKKSIKFYGKCNYSNYLKKIIKK